MLPMETSGSNGGTDSGNRSYNRSTDREAATEQREKERCRIGDVSSSQFIPFVPDSMAVPVTSFQQGFSHIEPSPDHIQRRYSYPYPSANNSLWKPQMINNHASSESHVLQDSCTYNVFNQNFSPYFNLVLNQIKNPVTLPFIQPDNNVINMRSSHSNESVFMEPSSQFGPPSIPGFAFSTNFPFRRPENTSETMQSRNLEFIQNSPTSSSSREFGTCEISGHQIFSQSQNLQRLSAQERMIVMRKELTKSDVGSIGRIVIPKKDAEANLPPLFEREGIMLPMDDVALPVTWEFRYRFWPNNKSRMYILENTGEFVKTHGLQAGDYLSIHKSRASAIYLVEGEKRAKPSE